MGQQRTVTGRMNQEVKGESVPSIGMIGTGPGGLSAAMLLAKSGARVHMYESQPVVGGRSRRTQVGDFAFDTGPTFFMMPYVLEEIFTATGRKLEDYCDLGRLDPMYRLLMGRPGQEPLQIDTTQDIEGCMPRRSSNFGQRLSCLSHVRQ